jgi:hypothetical protein
MFGAVSAPPTAPAAVPLSLLEALRNLDTPVEDGLEEQLSPEIVARRLGLSPTVAARIAGYAARLERGEAVPRDEAVSVLRLVSRRPDAALAYEDAGRRLARHAVRIRGGSARTVQRLTPNVVGRRVGQRSAARIARDVLGVELRFPGGLAEAKQAQPLTIEAVPDGTACTYFGAALGELLRLLTGFEGVVLHEQCRGQGGGACLWRTAPADGDPSA